MPKHEICHEAGNFVPDELAELLRKYFSDREVEKLERLGGLVTIKVTAPFKAREQRKTEPHTIDSSLVEFLRGMRTDSGALDRFLSTFTVSELRELGEYLNLPIRTSANRGEAIAEMVRYFSSEELWKRIADHHPD